MAGVAAAIIGTVSVPSGPVSGAIQVGRLVPEEWLGREVDVVVDRPLGSLHPSGGFRYPVNYGAVPGFVSPDGEELDAYVLGPATPVGAYRGRVVAVVLRADDVEDKLVVSRSDEWSPEAVRAQVEFQERFFDSTIVTAAERRPVFGRRDCRHQAAVLDEEGRLLLVRHRQLVSGRSYWVLPGGGAEAGEDGEACIVREVREETHLDVEVVRVLAEETVVDRTYDRTRTYLCAVVGGEARPGIEPEPELEGVYDIAEVGWWPVDDPGAWDESITGDAKTMAVLASVRAALARGG